MDLRRINFDDNNVLLPMDEIKSSLHVFGVRMICDGVVDLSNLGIGDGGARVVAAELGFVRSELRELSVCGEGVE